MVQRLSRYPDRTVILVGLVVLLSGCVTQPQTPPRRTPLPAPQTQTRQPSPAPLPPQTTPLPVPAPVMPERPPPQPKASVTLALQDEAQRAATAGDFSKATQILERAIRIEPDRAELWIELARVHLKEGNAAQAEQFARKALLFTHDRYDLEQQAWVVIADARAAKR